MLYLADLHASVIIMLKASLKWLPLIGPAMQMFRFVFMQKNWLLDRAPLALNLRRLSEKAAKGLDPFVLLICTLFGNWALLYFFFCDVF